MEAVRPIVVGRPGRPQWARDRSRGAGGILAAVVAALCMLLACMAGTGVALGDDGSADTVDPNSSYILDTQNLLGDDLSKVSDAITQTREETGVNVRLLYVTSFNTDEKPDAWAAETLKSLDPPANTVMLAVATNDGNLAVVVSPNSDEWLRSQETVDKLSEAASAPLVDQGDNGPDWAKSAIDMMEAIRTAQRTSTSSSAVSVGVIAMGGVVVLLVAVTVGFVVYRKRKRVGRHAHVEQRPR